MQNKCLYIRVLRAGTAKQLIKIVCVWRETVFGSLSNRFFLWIQLQSRVVSADRLSLCPFCITIHNSFLLFFFLCSHRQNVIIHNDKMIILLLLLRVGQSNEIECECDQSKWCDCTHRIAYYQRHTHRLRLLNNHWLHFMWKISKQKNKQLKLPICRVCVCVVSIDRCLRNVCSK